MRNSFPSNRHLALEAKEMVNKINTDTNEMIPYRVNAKTVLFFRNQERLESYKRGLVG